MEEGGRGRGWNAILFGKAVLLDLKTEEGAMSQNVEVAFTGRRRQGNRFSLGALRGSAVLTAP